MAVQHTVSKKKSPTYRGVGAAVVGVTTRNGEFLSLSQLRQAGLSVSGPSGSRSLVSNKEFLNVEELQESHEIREDEDPFDYTRDGAIEPPWNFPVLERLLTENVMHGAAVETKAADYAFNSWFLEPTDWAKEHIDEKVLEIATNEVTACLTTIVDGRPIEDAMRDMVIDVESLGSGGIEVRRTRKGFIGAINHIPFTTMRVTKRTIQEDLGVHFVQRRFSKKAFFTKFGDNAIFLNKNRKEFNPLIASPEDFPSFDKRESHISLQEPFVHVQTGEETNNIDHSANEFFMVPRPPFTKSSIYGTPAGISASKSMLAQLKIDDYNFEFFSSKGVPQYAVVFKHLSPSGTGEGQNLGDASDDPALDDNERIALENVIAEFFQKKLESGNRTVLVLTLNGEAEVSFEKLSTDTLEASFAEYEKRNQMNVLISHRVPKAAVGIDANQSGLGGGGKDLAQMIRYRDHIVNPGQRLIENVVNSLLRVGFLIPYFNFRLEPLRVEDKLSQQARLLTEYKEGTITLDEYREGTGREKVPNGKGNVYVIRSSNLSVIAPEPEDIEGALLHQLTAEEAQLRFSRLVSGDAALDDIDENEKEVIEFAKQLVGDDNGSA